jgi:hypothetical protein
MGMHSWVHAPFPEARQFVVVSSCENYGP